MSRIRQSGVHTVCSNKLVLTPETSQLGPSVVCPSAGSPSPALAADIQSLVNGLLSAVKNQACASGKACQPGSVGMVERAGPQRECEQAGTNDL